MEELKETQEVMLGMVELKKRKLYVPLWAIRKLQQSVQTTCSACSQSHHIPSLGMTVEIQCLC